MKIIKLTSLTSLNDSKSIYINVEQIGHFFEVNEKSSYGSVDKPKHTRVGVTTHNNGGFEVIESTEQIIKLIEKAK